MEKPQGKVIACEKYKQEKNKQIFGLISSLTGSHPNIKWSIGILLPAQEKWHNLNVHWAWWYIHHYIIVSPNKIETKWNHMTWTLI